MAIQQLSLAPSELYQAEAGRAAAMHDFECTFAMFSEVAAEACRIASQGASVSVDIGPNGMHVTICAPAFVGPLCVRNHHVSQFSARQYVSSGQFLDGDSVVCIDHCVTDRFDIRFHAPLSEVEPVIEAIFRRFDLIARNMDACRVWGVH